MSPIEKFKNDWQEDTVMVSLCESIFNHLRLDQNRLEHFSFARLKLISNTISDEKLAIALQYLSSPRCLVLKQIFLFFDGNDVIEFSPLEMAEIYREGAFIHPSFGFVVTDLNKILVAFEPGEFFSHLEVSSND